MIYRILRGDDKKGFGQWEGPSIDGYLPFAHRFEQRALGSWRGSIDFIRQQHIRKDGPFTKLKILCFTIKDVETGHITGQQVGGALQTTKRAAHSGSQGLAKCGFSKSG